MNRELKFRIWDKQYCKWLENSSSLHCYSNWTICPFTGNLVDYVGAIDSDHGDTFTASPAADCIRYGKFLKKPRYIIQQYTGKNDELDNEVYEGDIVYLNHYDVPEVDMSCLFEIIFESGAFQLKPFKLGKAPNGGVSLFHWLQYIEGEDEQGNTIYRYELPLPEPVCKFSRMRVIGNIFENPELLNL
jgi:hypothetical protein